MTRATIPVAPPVSAPRLPDRRHEPRNRFTARATAAWLALIACLTIGSARADDADGTTDSTSESARELSESSQTKQATRRKGAKASASASGMMSGSAGGRSMGQGGGFGGGQGQGSGGQMGPSFGGGGSNAASNAALQGQMNMRVSVSTDDDEEEEPQPDTLDPYVPGGPGGDDADDAQVMRRMEGGRRITTIERAGETVTITDSPTRIVVHRLDRTVDPPASSYVAATSPKALAAKDPAAYDLFDRYVVKTPAPGRPAARAGMPAMPGVPNLPGRPARAGLPEIPRTGNPEIDRMLDGFLNDQQ